jgi:hypothetical protein
MSSARLLVSILIIIAIGVTGSAHDGWAWLLVASVITRD